MNVTFRIAFLTQVVVCTHVADAMERLVAHWQQVSQSIGNWR
jgi:hypothetical protein